MTQITEPTSDQTFADDTRQPPLVAPDLLARLHARDEAAFAEVVAANSARLFAVAQRLLRNEDDAADAVQDAFLSAFKAIGAFHGEAKLSTWLHRIAVNAALMRLRRRRHRAEQPIDDLLPQFDEAGCFAEVAGGAATASHELIETRETRRMVRRSIDRLPETYRTVLIMRDIDDLDTDEVAALLGITANAVKIRLHRARQALRTLIEAEQYGEPSHAAAVSGLARPASNPHYGRSGAAQDAERSAQV